MLLLDRRVNVLVYLNRDWTEENGGTLELWDRGRNRCVERVVPKYNRTVIFNTTGGALHGHPDPVKGEGRARRAMSAYFFTNGRVPFHERWGTHGVLFNDEHVGVGTRARRAAQGLTPPMLYDAVRSVKDRFAARRRADQT